MVSIVIALRELYKNKVYRDRILDILEAKLVTGKPKTGRPGMELWPIFVLAQLRLSKHLSYGELHTVANYNTLIRQVMGIETEESFGKEEIPYQTIYDNVSLLDDETVKKINEVVVSFGHGEVFKKKETEALRVKTDSFVVESNVHFPTDYSLLWDCARKSLDTINWFTAKYPTEMQGWRKTKYWRKTLKSLMRRVGKANSSGGKNKAARLKKEVSEYLAQSKSLYEKLFLCIPNLPIKEVKDLASAILLEQYLLFLNKHNRALLEKLIPELILPKKRLSRCPDRGKAHFKRYVGLAVVSYNLCCIGRKLQKDYRKAEQLAQANIRKNAA
jgi:hypothetical protein